MEYEVYAIRYATREGRRSAHFMGGDPHDGPMPMDYFVWVVRSPERAWLVDTGFTRDEAQRRGRGFLRCPIDSLKLLSIDPATVSDVVLTHLHYDHAGNCDLLPNARFHLQEAEMTHATGRYMSIRCFGHGYRCEDVVSLVRINFGGRLRFHDGVAQLADGLSLHHIGGHTPGMQCVRVRTRRGWLVLASDTAHYYEHLETMRPFTTVTDVRQMIDGYRTLLELASDPANVVPGHDPQVMTRYPAPSAALDGIVVRLD